MPNFKTCVNGHNYDADQQSLCPFCPAAGNVSFDEKLLLDFKNTQIFDEGNNQQFAKTVINEENDYFKTTPVMGGKGGEHPFKRTSIVMDKLPESAAHPLQQTEKRKLVGWLVTFSNSEYGQDFRIYAGKNKIGSGADMDIVINDASISADHTTILYRDNIFLIKDNFSTNGTKINGDIVDEGKLKEGDELKLGNTVFKFKTVY
jgi:hypothetical protein